MKARLLTFSLLLTFIMMVAPQVSALDIRVLPNGGIEFFTGSILGRDSNGAEKMTTDYMPADRIKSVRNSRQDLRIRTKEDGFEVELRDKTVLRDDGRDFEKTERMDAEEINVVFPAKLDDSLDSDDNRSEYFKKLRTERGERTDELVELKNKVINKKQILELESRNVKANIRNGAEFNLDPVTNQVTIITPSGNEHVLNHLPDQAKQRMFEAGLFNDNDSSASGEIDIRTDEDGNVFYSKKDKIRKKLFGLFPRDVDSEIILDDATGEVTEVELESDSIFTEFFNSVSF